MSTDRYEDLSRERKALQANGDLPEWYVTPGWQMLKAKYLSEGETLKQRHQTISRVLASHMTGQEAEWEQKFFNLLWSGILSPATPALANIGTNKGMPVSCSGQVVDDNVDSFFTNLHETAMLSKHGFGTSADFSSIRPAGSAVSRGGVASGPVDTIELFFKVAGQITQGGKRRGSLGAYLDIEHPDWDQAADNLSINPNGKNYGWVLRDSFVTALKEDCPEAGRRFSKALMVKLKTGKGYFFFPDKANRQRPQMYKDLGLEVVATNLCTEIMLHSSPKLSYSCILSSMNLVHWETIKSTDAVFVATVFLDCICSEFIKASKGIPGLKKVRKFTKKGRAIGLGVMGFHTHLQDKSIPYVSLEANFLSDEIASHLASESLRASQWLAEFHGEPEWCEGYGVRNTHRTASAPTKSTALLMGGVSESWFPDPGMVYDSTSAVGEVRRIPPVLYKLMVDRGVYNNENLLDIINHVGSVQHVDWLTEDEKLTFLNAFEMDQLILLRMASQRQKHICQGQSINFYVPEDGEEERVAELLSRAVLDENILSQYYIYSRSGVVVKDECVSCSG